MIMLHCKPSRRPTTTAHYAVSEAPGRPLAHCTDDAKVAVWMRDCARRAGYPAYAVKVSARGMVVGVVRLEDLR